MVKDGYVNLTVANSSALYRFNSADSLVIWRKAEEITDGGTMASLIFDIRTVQDAYEARGISPMPGQLLRLLHRTAMVLSNQIPRINKLEKK